MATVFMNAPTASNNGHYHSRSSSSYSAPSTSPISQHKKQQQKLRSRTPEEAINELAALPSLSKSLNHLPLLDQKHISVYEGMPSMAQAKSHEKLKIAMSMTASTPRSPRHAVHDRQAMYSSHCGAKLAMTPAHASQSPAYTYSSRQARSNSDPRPHSRQKFTIGEDEQDDQEDDD